MEQSERTRAGSSNVQTCPAYPERCAGVGRAGFVVYGKVSQLNFVTFKLKLIAIPADLSNC
jgi:hypothetical protein